MAGISKFLVVDAAPEPRFALCSPDGAVLARGKFPVEAPVTDVVVIADLSLLARSELFQHSASGLVGHVADHGRQGDLLARVARRWAGTPTRLRATVRALDLYEYGPHLELRREYLRSAERTAANLLAYLRANFPDYADLLAPRGMLLDAALPLLLHYPTPRHLGSEGELKLKAALEREFAGIRYPIIDGFLQLHRGAQATPYTAQFMSYSEQYVRGAVEGHRFYSQLAASIDESVHQLMLPRANGAPAQPRDAAVPAQAPVPGSLAIAASAPKQIDVPVSELFDQVLVVADRAKTPDRNARLDLDRYRQLRAHIEAAVGAASETEVYAIDSSVGTANAAAMPAPAELLHATLIGEQLALAAGEYVEALQLRAEAKRIVRDHDPAAGSSGPALSRTEMLESEILGAVTNMITAGESNAFDELRTLLKDPHAVDVRPAVLSEGYGAMLMILVLYGEYHKNGALRARARAAVETIDGTNGAARAAFDIAELYIVAAEPGVTEQQLAELISTADEQSRETAYRPFFNLVMMLAAYVTGRSTDALRQFDEIERGQVWSRFNTALFAHAQLTAAMHHAGLGDFGTAHTMLAQTVGLASAETDPGLQVRIDVFRSLLDLTAGRHHEIFARTDNGGCLSEEFVGRVYTMRYLASVYLLRGTALVRDGATALGHLAFMRAAQHGADSGDWLAVLNAQSPEFLEWLSQLPVDELPKGFTAAMRDAHCARPVFFSHTLPQLSEQQARVLELLSLGRATSAIAAELSISGNTLKTHIRRLYQRLGVNSRREAVHVATAYGFVG